MNRKAVAKALVALVVLFGLPLVVISLIGSSDTGPVAPGPCKGDLAGLKQLSPHARAYARVTGTATSGDPRVTAGIVPISHRKVDKDVYCALPRNLQARSPSQVRTVVVIDYEDRVVGRYTVGGRAILIVAHLKIVDVKSHKRYSPSRELLGSDPPDIVHRYEGSGDLDEHGDPPTRAIAKYLERLAAPNT